MSVVGSTPHSFRAPLFVFVAASMMSAACMSSETLSNTPAETEPAGAAQPSTSPADSTLGQVVQFLVLHAPKKQVDPKTGAANPKIGRTPGSACEVVRFLAKALQHNPSNSAAADKMRRLADWVRSLQSMDRSRPRYGGVPSTPDLPRPANTYYYAIDAAFCSDAMFRLHELTGEDRYLKSAIAFAEFLLSMHAGPEKQRSGTANGFCEYVVDDGIKAAWNCRRYVKLLIALAPLAKAGKLTKQRRYDDAAHSARSFLVPGLSGAWEYAEVGGQAGCSGRTCAPAWRRVQGPQKQPDMFVYGDTLAYALRGLLEHEGLSSDVRTLYDQFAGFTGKGPKSRAYDGRIAFAGYMQPGTRSPDEFSAYYDLVTLGLLHELRRTYRKEHFDVANAVLAKISSSPSQLSWKMTFDLVVPPDDYVDLTTLANLGEALLLARR